MRFKDFEDDAKKLVAERRGVSVDRLDEVLPVIGGLARAGAIAARGVAGAATQAAKTGIQAVQKVGSAAIKGATAAGNNAVQKIASKNTQAMTKALLRKGAKIPMPSNQPGNRPEEFEVDNLQGDEVTFKNPKPKPGEPQKAVYKTKDLAPIIQSLSSQNEIK